MKSKALWFRANAILETTSLSLEKDEEENLGKPGDNWIENKQPESWGNKKEIKSYRVLMKEYQWDLSQTPISTCSRKDH